MNRYLTCLTAIAIGISSPTNSSDVIRATPESASNLLRRAVGETESLLSEAIPVTEEFARRADSIVGQVILDKLSRFRESCSWLRLQNDEFMELWAKAPRDPLNKAQMRSFAKLVRKIEFARTDAAVLNTTVRSHFWMWRNDRALEKSFAQITGLVNELNHIAIVYGDMLDEFILLAFPQ